MMKPALQSVAVACGALLAFGVGLAIVRQPALAAHAGAPYTNVDHRNDRGNDTGDSQIEGLKATRPELLLAQRAAARRRAQSAILCAPLASASPVSSCRLR